MGKGKIPSILIVIAILFIVTNLIFSVERIGNYTESNHSAHLIFIEDDQDDGIDSYTDDYYNYREYRRYENGNYESRRKASELFKEGLSAYREKDYQGAIKCYNEAIGLNPDYAGYHYYLGLAYERLNDFSSAIKSYNKALEIDPDVRFTRPKGVFFFKLKKVKRLYWKQKNHHKKMKFIKKNYIKNINKREIIDANPGNMGNKNPIWNIAGFFLLGLSGLLLIIYLSKKKNHYQL